MGPEITRRALVSGIAGFGLVPEFGAAAQVASPVASPALQAPTLHVAHFCRLTTQMPETWQFWDIGYDALMGSDGFFFATPSAESTLEGALDGFVLALALPERPVPMSFTWRNVDALRFDLNWLENVGETVIVPHAMPFEMFGELVTYVAISSDSGHMDGILESLSFDPTLVTSEIFLDSVIDHVEQLALYSSGVDWEYTRTIAFDQSVFGSDLAGTHRGISFVLNQLRAAGDRHSNFVSGAAAREENYTQSGFGFDISWDHVITVYPGTPAGKAGILVGDRILEIDGAQVEPPINQPALVARTEVTLTLSRKGSSETVKVHLVRDQYSLELVPTGRAIEPDISYLRIPLGVSPTFLDEYARAGHDLFRELDQASVQGWILDFRENYGGSYYPMLVTVVPLLPDGVLFGFRDRHGIVENTKLHDQTLQFSEGQELDLLPDSYTLQSSSAKIAILIDPTTSSAGELTAIMFKGLPNARFFGDDSNGLTTANLSLNLFDGSSLVLARSFEVDREGTVYEAGLQPDEYIAKNEQTYLLDEDPVIQAAVSWISSQ